MSSENEKFLKAYHAKHPGCTSQAMAEGRTSDGRSSYELLTSIVPTTGAGITVLDLACGDGFLLHRLLQRSPGLRLLGVDMSEDELIAAKRRIGDARVTLHQAKAQSIPLPGASVDYVLCHMAVMLMDSVESVIAEISRVLRPGGKFSAVVGSKGPKAAAKDTFVHLLREALQAEARSFRSGLGDPRIREDGGIRALFSRDTGFNEPLQIDDHVLSINLPVDKATEFFMLTYDPGLLSPEGLRKFEKKLRSSLERIADSRGLVACPTGLRHFTCERAYKRNV